MDKYGIKEVYVKVDRPPKVGDYISYENVHPYWSDITKDKKYQVIHKHNDYILVILDDDSSESSVYGANQGYDTPNDVDVWMKIDWKNGGN